MFSAFPVAVCVADVKKLYHVPDKGKLTWPVCATTSKFPTTTMLKESLVTTNDLNALARL